MSKYCPSCKGEFQDTIQQCPKDKVPLLNNLSPDELWVDFYLAENQIEAERIVTILRAAGIKAKEADSGIAQFPTKSDNRYVVLVPKSKYFEAREIIDDARHDDVISAHGSFL